jgi:phage FluMu protein Com
MAKCIRCNIDEGSVPLHNGLCRICKQLLDNSPQQPAMGWECPRCHKIHAPFIISCDCPPPFNTYITATSDPIEVVPKRFT